MAAKKKDASSGVPVTVLAPLALVWDNQYFELYAGDSTELPYDLCLHLTELGKVQPVHSAPIPAPVVEETVVEEVVEAPTEVVTEEAE